MAGITDSTVPRLHRQSQLAIICGLAMIWASGFIACWSPSLSLLFSLAALPAVVGSLIWAEANAVRLAARKTHD
jgi:hypothetical protein